MQMSMTGQIGTPLYMAPELFEDNAHYGPGVDVYAFAFLAYEIVTGKEPFKENGKKLSINMLLKNIISGKRPAIQDEIPEKMVELISRCWSQDPNQRPSFEDIFLQLSDYFSHFDEDIDSGEIEDYLTDLKEGISTVQTSQQTKNQIELSQLQKTNIKLRKDIKELQEQLNKSNKKCKKLKKELLTYKKDILDCIFVNIIKAEGLHTLKLGKKSNPFVTLKCGKECFQTKKCINTLNPVWNEVFKFDVKHGKLDSFLVLNMYNNDSKSCLMDEVKLSPIKFFSQISLINRTESPIMFSKSLILSFIIINEYVQINKEKSIHYFSLAANLDDGPSQYYLGCHHYQNIKSKQDINKCLYYLNMSCKNKFCWKILFDHL